MKKYQYFLFDWDGNLAQTLDVWLQCLKIALENRGHYLLDKEIGADFEAFKTRATQSGIRDVEAIVQEAYDLSANKLPYAELYPDALLVLEALHAKDKKLALVTTSKHDRIDASLAYYHLDQLFDSIICGDDVTNVKPDAEPLKKALALLGGNNKEAIMIGDSEKDIQGAYNAEIDSVLFYPPQHQVFYDLDALTNLKPTYIFDDFKKVLELT